MFIIIHNDTKAIHSRHRTIEAAQREFDKQSRRFEVWDGKRQRVDTTFPLNYRILEIDKNGNSQPKD